MLPGWYGFGSGLTAAIDRHGRAVLDTMLARWPFFALLLDDVEAMLARTDLEVAAYYDALASAELSIFADAVRLEYDLTVRTVLELRGANELLSSDSTLQRSIALRNPYIDPMHLMQVDLLRRWRATRREDASLFAALRATIGGIAQGLQATG
jgi:phosphoenolpyruvate carboxylase